MGIGMRGGWLAAIDGAVERARLGVSDGRSGSRLERVRLADGTVVVVKRVAPAWDWIVRSTGDTGRIVELASSGLLDRVPAVLDHTVLGAERDGDGWLVVMRDAGPLLVGDQARLDRAASRRVLDAAAALHTAFAATPAAERLPLCSMTARYAFLSPATAAREARGPFGPSHTGTGHRLVVGPDQLPGLIGRGWERFAEVVPADVAGPVLTVLDRPELLAAALARFPATLVHGDLKLGNLGFGPSGTVVALDWGTQTGWAPPAVELAWYLAINASRIDATREQVLDDFRASQGGANDEQALGLALFGGLVQLGWDKALQATGHADQAVRAREAADLDWWVARAREALAGWSP
jgi:aminoglycoside phosphotransferase (APT) family kinase protein